jgi:hypothetical protein
VTTAPEEKKGSPGITWAFFIGWFERGGKKTELLE